MKDWSARLIPKVLSGDKKLQNNFFLSILLSIIPAAFAIGTTVFNYSIFLSIYPSSWIPYWMLGEGFTIFILGNIFSLYTPKNFKKYIQANFLAISLILILILLLNWSTWYWAPFISILLLRACSSLLGAIIWSFISTLFFYRQYKAIFNRFTITASLSSIIAPLLYAGITSVLNVSVLPLLFLIFLVIAFFLTSFTAQIIDTEPSGENHKKTVSSSPIRYPLFRVLVIIFILFSTIFQAAEFLFRKQLEMNFADKEQIGTFVSLFMLLGNAGSLGTQFIASSVFSRVKFHIILQFIFSLILIAGIIYWITPALWPAVILCGIGIVFDYGWLSMIYKNIINIFPPLIIIKSQIFIKSYCNPLSSLIAAFFALLSTQSTIIINYFPIFFIVLSIIGIILSIQLFKRYSLTLKEMIMTSGFSFAMQDEKEKEYIKNLILTTINKPSAGSMEIALVTPRLFETPPSSLYKILADNSKKELHNIVIKVLDQYPSTILDSNKLIELYQKADLNQETQDLLYKLLSNVHSGILIKDAKARLEENPTAKNALLILLKHGDISDYIFAINLTKKFADSTSAKNRIIAAKLLSSLGPGRLYDIKEKLLTDKEPLVRITAFHHLPAQDVVDMLPILGKFLNHNTIKILHQRFEIAELLPLANQLMDLYYKNPHEYSESAQNFIVPLPDQGVEPFIIEFLKEKNTYLRTIIARQLLERKKSVTFSKKLCESLLDAMHFEVKLIQQYQLLMALESLRQLKPLLHNRIYYAKERFLYWYAAYHVNTANISSNIPRINPFHVTPDNKNIQDKGIEFLTTHENKLLVCKLIEKAFDDTVNLNVAEQDWQSILLDDPWLVNCLSQHPIGDMADMNLLQRTIALQQTDFFESLPDEVLYELGQSCEILDCAPEQIIITEGEEGDSLYVLVQGEILIYKNNELLATLKPFNCFGEMALFGANKRTSTAIAKDRAMLLVLNKADFFTITNAFPQILQNITRIISQRFQEQIAMLESKIQALETMNRKAGNSFTI